MSMKNKLLRVFQMGFSRGVAATTGYWNGQSRSDNPDIAEGWDRIYRSDMELALEEFINYMEKERV
jgi:hypothetical protein